MEPMEDPRELYGHWSTAQLALKAALKREEDLKLQASVMRTLLRSVAATWGEGWDCSANPGHQEMHYVMGTVHEYVKDMKA